MFYTLTFDPSLDYYVGLKKLNKGRVNRAQSARYVVGGKGINVSEMLYRLGMDTIALGFVGGFVGQEIARLAAEFPYPVHLVTTDGTSRINIKIRAQEETDVNTAGVSPTARDLDELLVALSGMSSRDTLIISGSVPKTSVKEALMPILEFAAAREARLVTDLSGEALATAIRYKPWLIKPNREELEELCGQKFGGIEDVANAASGVIKQGVTNLIASMDKDGAVLMDGEGGFYVQRAKKGEAVNTTGAGDAMLAAFLAAAEYGYSKESALGYAVCAGSAAAFCEFLPTKAEIDALLNDKSR